MSGPILAGTGNQLDSLATIYSEFKLTYEEKPLMRSLATQRTLKANSGRNYEILDYSNLQAYELTDGVDHTIEQEIFDTPTSFTPNEVGLKLLIAKTTLRRIPDPGFMSKAGRIAANAYNTKVDRDGADEMTSWTPSMGAAGTVASPGLLMSAVARVQTGNKRRTSTTNPEPAQGRIVGVWHPYAAHALVGRLMPLTDVPTGTNAYTGVANGTTVGPGARARTDELLAKGIAAIGEVNGSRHYISNNLLVDANDDVSNAVFDQDRFYFISEIEPDEGKEYDNSHRVWELMIAGSYTYGIHKPSVGGIEVITDASTPTA